MKAGVLFRLAATSIGRNKMRSLLTMLGIIIGVGAVIMTVAVGSGAQRSIGEQIQSLGTNMLVITPGSAQLAGVSQGAQSFTRLTIEDVETLRDMSALLSGISPVIPAREQIIGGAGNWRTSVMGVDPDYLVIRDWAVESGVSFDAAAVRASRKDVLLGSTVAQQLFPDGDAVGRNVRLGAIPVTIVGVLEPKGQTAGGMDQDDVILAPYTMVQNRMAGRLFIPMILASVISPGQIAQAQDEITEILRDRHGLVQNEPDDFTVRNQNELAQAAQSTSRVMTILLAAIASISLVVGGIGIMNIMLVSVKERTREIGLRLAIGARSSDVMVQFLVESAVLSLAGGGLGVALGLVGSLVLGRVTGWTTSITLVTVIVALIFALSVGIGFGFYPARKAATLDPILALRYE